MPDTSSSTVISARIAIAGTLFFAFVMYVAFAIIQPELDPLYRFGSEYSVGRMGWLMKLAFFVWSGGLMAFAFAIVKGLDAESRSYTAIALFAIGALGVFSRVFSTPTYRFSMKAHRHSGLRCPLPMSRFCMLRRA